jgi:GTP diphosphokinase / guanosine-3',5'-bis(diphosphate) 3'-diphosphatase
VQVAVARRLAALAAGAPRAETTADAEHAVRPLIAAHRRIFPSADADLLRRAYAVADHWHSGQVRKSGAPYITHPLAVAILLADIGMDTTTLVAALLHDTVEDTGLTIGQVKAEFGPEVAVLVDGVTKLDGSKWGDHAEGETFRKMILAASIDLRVLVIKLADRVHNLRTLGHHAKREKRERIARASMELLVPFAQRLGLYEYQREMEDLAFATLSPEAHDRVAALVRQTEESRRADLGVLINGMRAELAAAGVRAQVEARARHLYSIHRSLPGGGRISGAGAGNDAGAEPLRPTDAARVVVVVDGAEGDCYVALGVLHGRWHPVEDRFRDYISMPKYNMYRSLHTVILVGGEPVNVLIRTRAMDAVANHGVAARIREAGGRDGKVSADLARQADLDWLNRLLAWQPLAAPGEFLDGLRADLSQGMIVFTLDGTPVKLPAGSTAVDFAYAVSPSTAGSAVGVLVNGMRKPMENSLSHGQVVDLITGPYADPPDSWLAAAHSGHARAHLKAAIARRKADEASALGRAAVAKALCAQRTGQGDSLRELEDDGTAFSAARKLGFPDLDALYEAVGLDKLSVPGFLAHLGFAAPPV